MACCGRTFSYSLVVPPVVPVVSVQGLVKMKYTGLYTLNWYIGKTGAKYEFGLLRHIGYVDGRDIEALQTIQEDGTKVFEVAT